MRTTQDHRIIIGGLDVNTTYPDDRDAKIIHKKEQLIEEFNHLFPNIVVYPEFYLGAFYGGTHDGLPIIGEYEEFPNCYFLFAYGDNGLVYSNALAKIMRDVLVNGSHPAMDLYHQTRS
jgi:glycine/D-amino acid oxidase-like deaminating enzyme